MKVFIVGATGYLSAAIAVKLLSAGCQVSGLVRDLEKARPLAAAGLKPVAGDARDSARVAELVAEADAVIFATTLPFDQEAAAMEPALDRLAGSGKTFIFTSGTAVLSIDTPDGAWREESFAEDDPWTPVDRMKVRIDTEQLVRSAAARGVRAMVIRPPLIWGNGGSKQVPAIFDSVGATGAACYIGQGLNCYSNVHVEDLAWLYQLALERGVAGALYHSVAGEVSFRSLAEAVGQVMGCPTRSVDMDEARRIWGNRLAPMYFGVSSRSRSPRARSELGWSPRHLDLVEDIRSGSYRAAYRPVGASA
jgi:nucleoside-diphosphate-sugar epimerase